MAGRKDDFDKFDDGLGDFDNFDNWDDGGWDGADPAANTSRDPVSRIAGGFKKGAADAFKDKNVQKRLLKSALPEGYGRAIDGVDDAVGSVRTLYDNTVTELKPQLQQMLRSTQKILPPGTKILPESLSKRLSKWIADESYHAPSEEENNNSEISIAMASIFKQQAEVDEARQTREDSEERLKDGIKQKQFKTNLDQLSAIRSGMERLVGFQDSITIAYQRKSLELQYRHYFATRKLVELSQNYFSKSTILQDNILKNTALPDLVKMQTNEIAKQMLKERSLASAGGFIRDKLKGTPERIGRNAKQMFQDFTASASEAMSNVTMMADQADMGVPIDFLNIAGEGLGAGAGEWAGGKVSKVLGNRLAKVPGVRAVGNWLMRASQDFGENVNKFARSETTAEGGKGMILNFLKELVGGVSRDDSIRSSAADKLDQAAGFTYRTQAAITEVIPGWLAKINSGITSLRTGSESELETYDYASGRFITSTKIRDNITERLFGADTRKSIDARFERLVKTLGIEGKVSRSALKALKEIILRRSSEGLDFTPEEYAEPTFYTGLTTEKIGNELASAISVKYPPKAPEDYSGLEDGTESKLDVLRRKAQGGWSDITNDQKQIDLLSTSNAYRELADAVPDVRSMMIEEARAGNLDILRAMGLVSDEQGNTSQNFDNVLKGLMGNGKPKRKRKGSVGAGNGPSVFGPFGGSGPSPSGFNDMGNSDVITDAVDLDALRSSIDESTDRIIAALSDRASESTGQVAAETLGRIAELVAALGTIVIQTGGGSNEGGPSVGSATNGALFSEILGRGFNTAGSVSKTLLSTLNSGRKRINRVLGSALGGARSVAGGILGKGRDLWDQHKSKLEDIYVKGRNTVSIRINELLAGEYIDVNTGKIIKSVKDITGEVKDKMGNIIITAEEAARGFYTRSGKNILLKIRDTVKGGVSAVNNKLFNAQAMISKAGRMVMDHVAVYSDVYVRGDMDTPRLNANLIRKGYYLLKATGAAITRYEDITGVVVDSDGNEVLSAADLKAGLVDNAGKPIKGLSDRLIGLAAGAIQAGNKLAKGVMGKLKSVGKGIWNKAKSIGGRILSVGDGDSGALISIFGEQSRSTSVLERIYGLLDARMTGGTAGAGGSKFVGPSKPKGSIFDTDGDGFREGSWQDTGDAKADGDEPSGNAVAATGDKPKGGKGIFGMLGKIGGFVKMLAMGAVGFIPKMLGMFKGIGKVMGGLWTVMKSVGKVMGGLFKVIKPLASAIFSLTKFLGKGLLGAGKGLIKGALNVGKALLSPKGLLVRGAMMAGSAIASGVGAVVGAVGLPVIATALAVGAVAYGGYKLYKHLKSKDLNVLKARMVAYGIDPSNDAKVEQVFALEQMLSKNVDVSDGKAAVLGKGVTVDEVIKPFGISTEDGERYEQWMEWFLKRFKPIYLTYVTINNDMRNGKDLTEADAKLTNTQRSEMVSRAQFPYDAESPYAIMASPFDDRLDYNIEATRNELDAIRSDLKIAANKDPSAKSKTPADAKAKKAAADKSDAALEKAENAKSSVWDSMSKGLSTAGSFLSGAASKVGSALSGAKDWLGGKAKGMATFVGGAVSGAAAQLSGGLNTIRETVSNGASAAMDAVASTWREVTGEPKRNRTALLKEMVAQGITDPKEQAGLMAQVDHESGGFKRLSENLRYKASTLLSMFSAAKAAGPSDVAATVAKGPAAIAELIYSGRMGNGKRGAGEGAKYIGRGLIQLTGKDNYIAAGKALGIDLENHPELASEPDVAAKIAVWYWKTRVSAKGRAGDVLAATKSINGGTNGLQDRMSKFKMYLAKTETGELMKELGVAPIKPTKGDVRADGVPTLLAKPTDTPAKETRVASNTGVPEYLAKPVNTHVAPPVTTSTTPQDNSGVVQAAYNATQAAQTQTQKAHESKATVDNMQGLGGILQQSLEAQLRMDRTLTDVKAVLVGIDSKFTLPTMRGNDLPPPAKPAAMPNAAGPIGSARKPPVSLAVNRPL